MVCSASTPITRRVFKEDIDYMRFRYVGHKRIGGYVQYRVHCDRLQTEAFVRRCLEQAVASVKEKAGEASKGKKVTWMKQWHAETRSEEDDD